MTKNPEVRQVAVKWVRLRSPAFIAAASSTAFLFFLLARDLPADDEGAGAPPGTELTLLHSAEELAGEEKWQSILDLLATGRSESADLNYYRGMALAKLKRLPEAREEFERGYRKAPSDKRFLLELAGIDFRLGDLAASRKGLKRALSLDPDDAYATDFLATLYYLEGNLDAALAYWNRIDKPRIEEIRMDPALRVNPVLLDRSFAFSPANVLNLTEISLTRTYLDHLNLFSHYRFELVPRQEGNFDLLLRASERPGWKSSWVDRLSSLLLEAPYQTLHWDVFDIGGSAMNFESLLRWDAQKRRAFFSLSGPFKKEPARRFSLRLDARDENWIVPSAADDKEWMFGLRKVEAAGEIESIVNDRWTWKSGVAIASRRFPNHPGGADAGMFIEGLSLKYEAGVRHRMIYLPENKLTVQSSAKVQIGKIFRSPGDPFTRLSGGVEWTWSPQSRGDDYRTQGRFVAGETIGYVPFDELTSLGLDRDNDLYLRGHLGTTEGRKGAGPLGGNYMLLNCDTDKILYNGMFWDFRLGPFLDTGRVYASSGYLGSRSWLWDVGPQAKIRFLKRYTLAASYGFDLRSGARVFYTTLSR